MDIRDYPEYAAIQSQIRAARVEHAVVVAHAIAAFLMDCWNAIKAPPAPPAILRMDRRRESRHDVARLAHR